MSSPPGPPIIQLAPKHKVGLRLRNPVMIAANCYGLGRAYRDLVDEEALGAIVVGPVTWRRRRGAQPPRALTTTGGVVVHTGLANPGLPRTLREYRRIWAGTPTAVILHLAATSTEEITAACESLNNIEEIAAVELGLADHVAPDEAAALVSTAGWSYGQGALLVRLPLHSAAWLAEAVVSAGADALTIGAPPRGSALSDQGRFVTGRIYGPLVLPLALRALRQVARVVDVPLVGCGGIYRSEDAQAFLAAGATAVQIGATIWRDPSTAARIARELSEPTPQA